MARIHLLDRVLGSMSGVEAAHIPEVLPPAPSLPVPVSPHPLPEMKKNWWSYKYGLSHPLFHLSPHDPWTIADSFEGTIVTGDSGGGKSSGSGATIAKGVLHSGFGGLVMTHKSDEVTRWTQYAKETGRLSDLLIVAPGTEPDTPRTPSTPL